MIGSLTFTRDDGATFTFSATNPPYQLTPDTQLPAGLTLDVSGGEYTGRNGGYTLAGRLQRRTAKIVYNVRETYADSRSMVQLLNDASEFFRPMTADLRIVSFDMLVQTDDSNQSAYLMRQGHVTTPFMAPLLRGGHGSYAAEFDLIFDDPLLYWADGSGVVRGDILPAALPGSKIGETWQEGLQVWAAGLSRWEYPDQGGGGTPQTVRVVSAYQVPVAFTITGRITNPKIVNSRNGSQWSWEGTIPYGRVVTVDVDGVATGWQGNRLLNTMGGLVAAPGDNTFTLTGSDLVLDLKAAWTGTANASTSTLSQDGAVVATNLVTDPNALQKVGTWSATGSTTAVQRPDGHWVYTPDSDVKDVFIVFDPKLIPAVNDYLYCSWEGGTGDGYIPYCDIVAHGDGWCLSQYHGDPGNPTIAPGLNGTPITLLKVGRYSAADYAAMKSLGVNWFDGDSTFNIVTAKASVEIRGAF